MSARSQRLDRSLGSSWGDADYESDNGGSIHSASDDASEVELEGSDKEVVQEEIATPRQPRNKRNNMSQSTPASQPQVTPIRKPANRTKASQSQTIGSDQSTPRPSNNVRKTPGQGSIEHNFIMPSINNSPSGYTASPMRSQPRNRGQNTLQNRFPNSPRPVFSNQEASTTDQYPPARQEQEEVSPWHYVNLFWENVAQPLLAQFLDIFSYAFRHMIKPFLGVALGLAILFFSIRMAHGFLRSTVSNAVLGPICALPGSSYLLSACATTAATPTANFEELVNIQGHFEEIIDASKDSHTLPSTIKNSELAIRDLRTLVRYSRLPSRKELDNEFEYFVQTANEASADLSRYNSKIGLAIDRVLATNKWTAQVLQGISEKEASTGAVSRVFNSLTGAFVAPPPSLQERIFDQYVLHIGKNKEEITGLIERAQALLQVLNNLDNRLATIFEIATHDDQSITKSQEELLSSLWTKLGGNRSDVKANAISLNLLQNISAYRRKAVVHVSETLLKLQEILAELENLREVVAAPQVLGWRGEVPLTFHIEAVGRGTERLELVRGEQKRVEGESVRRILRGDGDGEVRELGGPTVTVRAG